MKKPYKISYKTYLNSRLKKVIFHNQDTYPLYVQVTFMKKTIFFKSAFFQIYSDSRYGKGRKAPSVDFVMEKEKQLIDYVIERQRENFSLENFKQAYDYYSLDLCTSTEQACRTVITTFFSGRGLPVFGLTLSKGSKDHVLYDLLYEMKSLLLPDVYKSFNKALSTAPPYPFLYGFMMRFKDWPDKTITVMEWENENTIAAFEEYIKKKHPERNVEQIKRAVNKWLDNIRLVTN